MAVLATAGLLALGQGAGAVPGGSTVTAVTKSTVGVGQSNQPAGNLVIRSNLPGAIWTAGEQIVLSLDDGNPVGVDPNCTIPTDFVAFSASPTVAIAGTATLGTTVIRSGPACSSPPLAPGSTRTDQLVITIATAGTATITISGIRYDVGTTGVATGDVTVTAVASDALGPVVAGPGASNAFVATVRLTANSPPKGLRKGNGAQAVSNLVLTEQVLDAASSAGPLSTLCIRLTGGFFDSSGVPPAAAVSPGGVGGDAATVAFWPTGPVPATGLEITVTDFVGDTVPSTITVSGVRLDGVTTAGEGVKTVVLTSGSCVAPVSPATTMSTPTNLTAVVDLERFGASDRYTTAQTLFEDAFACGGGTGLASAVIARGNSFADALAASYLAGTLPGSGTNVGTGILLVDPNNPVAPAATLNALRNRGVDIVYVIGQELAVPAALASALDSTPNFNCAGAQEATAGGAPKTLDVVRVGGGDRYETARAVAERPGLGAAGTVDVDGTPGDPDGPACTPRRTAIVATGENFPDAVAAGSVAFEGLNAPGGPGGTVVPPGLAGCGDNRGFPLILTPGDALHPQAQAALVNLGIQQVILMGGTSALSTAVKTAIEALPGGVATIRVAGGNRIDTARLFAEFAIGFLGYDAQDVGVARGDDFPDALTGGPHAAANPDSTASVVLLVESPDSAGTETLAFFRERQGTSGVFGVPNPRLVVDELDVYGGGGAVTEATVEAILAAISQA